MTPLLPLLLALAPAADPSVGAVTGRVVWRGPAPTVMPLDPVLPDGLGANPFTPRIDPDYGGVGGVVVMLRGVDPARAKPWDLPPARIEASREAIHVYQGDTAGRVGFVRRGVEVPIRWHGAEYRTLRARGAAFWTLAFPDGNTERVRRFDKTGAVRLTGGSGEFWLAADLWVCDHPYFAVTADDGSFRFDAVPAGPCEVVTWMPSWDVVGKDRDPETGLISRVHWGKPHERAVPIAAPAAGVEIGVE